MKRIVLCFAALLALGAGAQAGGIVVPAEQRYSPYSGDLPACDDPGVLAQIGGRFAQRESEYWSSSSRIAGFDRVEEIGLRSNGLDYIPRRYCVARALDDVSQARDVVYQIEEGLGGLPAASRHAAVLASDALRELLARLLQPQNGIGP